MSDKVIYLLTPPDKFFGQTRKPWVSMDVDKIVSTIESYGYEIKIIQFSEICNSNVHLEDATILYPFSQKENYRNYITDIIYHLSKKNRVIPSFDLLKCHENKGYQELYKKDLGIKSLEALYYGSVKEIDLEKIEFPTIVKDIEGSNGNNVLLIKSRQEFKSIEKRFSRIESFKLKADLLRRRFFRKKKFKEYPNFCNKQDYCEYKEYKKSESNFIFQKFVPNLDHDYRVLVLHDKYFVTRRGVKKGDFRASGAKMFSFDQDPDSNLLNYAKSIFEKFDTPILSIDIVFDGNKYYLIEFQALHFGINVFVKSKGCFINQDGEWKFEKREGDIEEYLGNALSSYLEQK